MTPAAQREGPPVTRETPGTPGDRWGQTFIYTGGFWGAGYPGGGRSNTGANCDGKTVNLAEIGQIGHYTRAGDPDISEALKRAAIRETRGHEKRGVDFCGYICYYSPRREVKADVPE